MCGERLTIRIALGCVLRTFFFIIVFAFTKNRLFSSLGSSVVLLVTIIEAGLHCCTGLAAAYASVRGQLLLYTGIGGGCSGQETLDRENTVFTVVATIASTPAIILRNDGFLIIADAASSTTT